MRKNYSPEQLDAWASGSINKAEWDASLRAHDTVVAEAGGVIVGFGDRGGSYLDRLYVHSGWQGRGVETAILTALEHHARKSGQQRMETHVCVTAKPFFERRGYRVVREQQVMRRGISLTNFMMEKALV